MKYEKKQKYFETIGPKDFKADFPILNTGIIYLDNAATTQKPSLVIQRIRDFYESENASTHSGIYPLSEKATSSLESARGEFARFINSGREEIIFTKNATDGFNMIAEMLSGSMQIGKGDNIVVSEIEHHSNFVPWQQLAKKSGCELRIAKYDSASESIAPQDLVDANTKIVAFTLMSNVSGLIPEAEKIIAGIKRKNRSAIIVCDATQAAAHFKIDVKKINADFLCFSAHKLYGPTGVGIIFGKIEVLSKLKPARFGGHMIRNVTAKDSTWADLPDRLEPGTINTEGILGAAAALTYMNKNKIPSLFQKEEKLKSQAIRELKRISGVKIIGHQKGSYGPIIAFTMEGIHPHDIASICARHNVYIRAGHQCCQMFHSSLGIPASARISISFYNEESDINAFASALKDAAEIFKAKK